MGGAGRRQGTWVQGGTGPQGNTSLGNTSASCSPSSPRLPHPAPAFPPGPSESGREARLELGGPDLHQKQIPCSLGVRHCDIYEQGSGREATSTWGPSPECLCILGMCSKVCGLGHFPSRDPCIHLPPSLSVPYPGFPLCTSCSLELSPLPSSTRMSPAAALRPGQEGFLCSPLAPRGQSA